MRQHLRMRVQDGGCLEVVDPDWASLPLLRAIDPRFRVRRLPLPGFHRPRILETLATQLPATKAALASLSEEELWRLHDSAMSGAATAPKSAISPSAASTLLDVKRELASRLAGPCRLCARRCGVDRRHGEHGTCGLGMAGVVAEHFTHVAEEPPINPSLLISLAGCGLRCKACQQGPLLAPASVAGRDLGPDLWRDLDFTRARSLSFAGGNPDESLPAILGFLAGMPHDFRLPIAWNCHAYSTPEVLALLAGVVDVWVPDLKYGSATCGSKWSSVASYPQQALAAVQAMLKQDVPVFVRLLVLPGHFECCHRPALRALAEIAGQEQLHVRISGQYAPDWKVTEGDGGMARRPQANEIAAAVALAKSLGLKLI